MQCTAREKTKQWPKQQGAGSPLRQAEVHRRRKAARPPGCPRLGRRPVAGRRAGRSAAAAAEERAAEPGGAHGDVVVGGGGGGGGRERGSHHVLQPLRLAQGLVHDARLVHLVYVHPQHGLRPSPPLRRRPELRALEDAVAPAPARTRHQA